MAAGHEPRTHLEPVYHGTLQRQLRRLGLHAATPPDAGAWAALLAEVSGQYTAADGERCRLSRSVAAAAEEMRDLHDELTAQVRHDSLTGLPNRAGLIERLTEARARAERAGRTLAVLFIDLDGFKAVNDNLGHAAGDELLVRAAGRIRSAVRHGDVVGRLGGDEFVVLCEEVDHLDVVTGVAGRIVELLESPFRLGSQEAFVSASIGVAASVAGEVTAEALLRRADLAMYRAKSLGRARYVVFDAGMEDMVEMHHRTEAALRTAASANELVLHYQPVVHLGTDEIVLVEALVRWDRPGVGLLGPDQFLPLAEQVRLINGIGAWVLHTACADAAGWEGSEVQVAVNMTTRELAQDEVVRVLISALQRSGLPAARLVVEVKESTLSGDSEALHHNIARLRSLGVRLAIDDVGTGASALARLRRVPAQAIKLARELCAEVDTDRQAAAIVAALIEMGHALDMTVVAAGVERPSQLEVLRRLRCDAAQGFAVAAPQPAVAMRDALRRGRTAA